MKQLWSIEELVEHWSLGVEDQELLAGKHASGRLGFAAQLAFYRLHAWFPDQLGDFAPAVIAHLADQIAIPEAALDGYDWRGRTERRHRQDIIEALGVWPFDAKAEAAFRIWLLEDVIPAAPDIGSIGGADQRMDGGRDRRIPPESIDPVRSPDPRDPRLSASPFAPNAGSSRISSTTSSKFRARHSSCSGSLRRPWETPTALCEMSSFL
jgi:hypothetical protein